MAQSPQINPDHRLDSWKEIAAFFGRNERTVRRWATGRALPVHRIPGAAKGRIFAFESELREWLAASGEQDQPNPQEPETKLPVALLKPTGFRSARTWLTALTLCVVAVTILGFLVTRRFTVHAWPLSGSAIGKSDPVNPGSSQSEDLYLQGRYYWNRRTPEDLNRAVDYFTQAIAQDPNSSKAYVGLADSYDLLREYSAMPSSEAYPRALAAATKAVQLDGSSADAHLSLAYVTFYWSWDTAGAEDEFKRALTLDPNDARAHHWYATFLLTSQRLPESLAQINQAQSLDPSSVAILADKAEILHYSHQTDSAMALLKQIETTEPSFTDAHRYMSEISLARKDYSDYLKEWREMAVLLHDQQGLEVESAAEKGFATGGYHGMLESTLAAQKKLNGEGTVPDFSLAVTYALLGEKQNSLQCLRVAYEKHDSSLLFLMTEPAFHTLRNEPEFKDLVARVCPGTPQDSL